MGRLIDADDVMEMLTNIELSCTVIPITEAKLRLRDIPTAYDIDKVVEELEEVHNKFCKNVVCGGKSRSELCEYCEECIMFNKNIEIVKQGGTGKDVE